MSKKNLDAMNLMDESTAAELLQDFNEKYVGCELGELHADAVTSVIRILSNVYDTEDNGTFINSAVNFTEVIAIYFIDEFYEHKKIPFDYLGKPAFTEFLAHVSVSFITTARKASLLHDVFETVLDM